MSAGVAGGEKLLNERIMAGGYSLPPPAAAVASYEPFLRHGELLLVSGQLPMRDGEAAYTGVLRDDGDLADGVAAAELAALNLLAQLNVALAGELGGLKRCLRLRGYVAAASGFTAHSKVVDGASNLLKLALGDDKGSHTRAAVGVSSLPLGATVELEAMFAVGG